MITLLETTIVALTVQVGARDIDSIHTETGMDWDKITESLSILAKRRAVRRTMSGGFTAFRYTGRADRLPQRLVKETMRP